MIAGAMASILGIFSFLDYVVAYLDKKVKDSH